jgi:co-chaperonin GroES (HSP10)
MSNEAQIKSLKQPDIISSADFKIGDTVLYEGYTCMVKKKQGKKCLAIPMPMGWTYFIPVWADVKRT